MTGRALISPAGVRAALALADAARAQVRRVIWNGEVYHAAFVDGQPADPETMRAWAGAEDPRRAGRPPRRVRFVVMDESVMVPGSAMEGWRIDPAGLRLGQGPYWDYAGGLALTFLDTRLIIGICDAVTLEPAGTVPGAVGRALVADARIYDTQLGSLAWGAVRRGLFDGVCVAIDHLDHRADGTIVTPIDWDPEAKVIHAGVAAYVIVGDLGSSCCGNARLLRTWEGDELHSPIAIPSAVRIEFP